MQEFLSKTLKKMWELIFQRLSKISVALLLYISIYLIIIIIKL